MKIFMFCLGAIGTIIMAVYKTRKNMTGKDLVIVYIGFILMMICLAYIGATDPKH
ncbi:hypothetical protein [Bacillus cereus group sp. BfR-BA-01380]|uniref:hypothetical protein n=1 Tax=Bacillus cereus group sp. BfR-BA-01380 TaxID=2920324 RepID=UPI001F58392C|nr:hypothetical protein [Bacillus cereus group sp. BfR-BA-01380]